MQLQAFTALKTLQNEPGLVAELLQFAAIINMHISVAKKVEEGQFDIVHKPVQGAQGIVMSRRMSLPLGRKQRCTLAKNFSGLG